jgi:hypothetical protein
MYEVKYHKVGFGRAVFMAAFVVFLTIASNYVRFNEEQSEYIRTHKWVTDVGVVFIGFTSLELVNPAPHSVAINLGIALIILAIYKVVTRGLDVTKWWGGAGASAPLRSGDTEDASPVEML